MTRISQHHARNGRSWAVGGPGRPHGCVSGRTKGPSTWAPPETTTSRSSNGMGPTRGPHDGSICGQVANKLQLVCPSQATLTRVAPRTYYLRLSRFRRRLGSSVPSRTSGNSKNHSYSYKLIILFYLKNSPISGHAIFLDVRLVSSGI